MMKIDRTELLRCFILLEIVLVFIPIAFFWSIMGILALVAGFNLTTLNLCCVWLLFHLYFLLPSLIASGLFRRSLIGVMPESVAGWLFIVLTYTVMVFLMALALSLYTPLNRQGKTQKTSNRP
jgi:hypothetical protein